MISLKQSSNYVFQAIQSLLNFLRHDPNVFQKFRPSKPLLQKMNLDKYVLDNEEPLCDKILEFYSFLLRYHREIDQTDFSSNPVVLKKLKRYEEFKSWSELEELAMQQEKFDKYIKEWGSAPRVGKEQ